MSVPNVTEMVTTTLESRNRKIVDNAIKNNAVLTWLEKDGNVKPVSGGRIIYEEMGYAENGNAGWYSGYDPLSIAAQDTLSAAEFNYKQAACAVVISGLEILQNSGKEQLIDLLESRISMAETSMANLLAVGLYSDGTGYGGKQITGLDAAVPATPTTGTYGGIDRQLWSFWQSVASTGYSGTETSSTIQGSMNGLWAQLVQGQNRPNLILADNVTWAMYMASLQAIQRFTDPNSAKLGFPSIKFMDADVVLDGGIGGAATASTMYFLNTKYLKFRPHKDRNMVPLNPKSRWSVNQDAEVQILAWAGNMTCCGSRYQGRLTIT